MGISMDKQRFEIEGKLVEVFSCQKPDKPVIYLNTFGGESNGLYREIKKRTDRESSLVTIGGLDWNRDMSPWDIPPIAENDTPCTGGADDYLRILTEKIIPSAEQKIQGTPQWRGIAGYSLAGLFAIYSLYRTDVFSRAASISGSLWFPNFMEYIDCHDFKCTPDRVYFSLGDRESRTNNPFLKPVQENTEQIKDYYAGKGIVTELVMNKGSHYKNAALRTVQGLQWILEH